MPSRAAEHCRAVMQLAARRDAQRGRRGALAELVEDNRLGIGEKRGLLAACGMPAVPGARAGMSV